MYLALITGGARSGKSRYALGLAAASGEPVTFIATAQPGDAEMADRIARHRAERPPGWTTVETPHGVALALAAALTPVVVLDCLTLLASNLLLLDGRADPAAEMDPTGTEADGTPLEREVDALLAARAARAGTLIVVTNEVGLGVVPATPLGRAFRDALGDANRTVAGAADEVILMVSGLPLGIGSPGPARRT